MPDSSRYVPGRGAVHVSEVGVTPAATSVENDCTRGPCAAGSFVVEASATGHVAPCVACGGLTVDVAVVPRPPPNWPTIVSEVGMVFVPPPATNERLFVRLICSVCPAGTVITTGDQVDTDNGFKAAHVAVETASAAPQK